MYGEWSHEEISNIKAAVQALRLGAKCLAPESAYAQLATLESLQISENLHIPNLFDVHKLLALSVIHSYEVQLQTYPSPVTYFVAW